MTYKFSYLEAGHFLVYSSGIAIALLTFFIVFEDSLFSKSDTEKFLSEQSIYLNDDFDLLENESMSSPGGDYFHTFTLRLSALDKQTIVRSIRTSPNFSFKMSETWIDDRLFLVLNRYTGKKTIRNYETNSFFIRELFEPQGTGYAPKFRRIKINREGNTLSVEDIVD